MANVPQQLGSALDAAHSEEVIDHTNWPIDSETDKRISNLLEADQNDWALRGDM